MMISTYDNPSVYLSNSSSTTNPTERSKSFHQFQNQFSQLNLFTSRTPSNQQQINSSDQQFYPSTFTVTPLKDLHRSNVNFIDDDPSLEYLHYTMDSLIQRLVPTDIYIPKYSFVYPMLLCSRIHLRPSLLFNQWARLTIQSISTMSFDRSIKTLNNYLYLLSQWTRTFPYDFRQNELMSQLDDLFTKIIEFESSFHPTTQHIRKKLRSKLKSLDQHEEYLRQLSEKAMFNLSQLALVTDIITECPSSIFFAQQLTQIELDRLKSVGAEELIQYYLIKLSQEESVVNSTRLDGSMSGDETRKKICFDPKLTICLESYIQWFNRLTYFVTTEIVKHTQRRSRVRLINYFIDAAYQCFRYHNFNSMIAILGGLNMKPVRRLKKTWEKISMEKFVQLEQFIDVSKNFSTYRLILRTSIDEAEKCQWNSESLVVPFLSLVLQDVYFIKTHSQDLTTAGGINLKKYNALAKFITEEFVCCQQSQCSFERNDVIINYILTCPTFNEEALMLASFECESPSTTNEKEKHRSLQKSI